MALKRNESDKADGSSGMGSLGDALLEAAAKKPDSAVAGELLAGGERSLESGNAQVINPEPVAQPIPAATPVQPAPTARPVQPAAPTHNHNSQTFESKEQKMEQANAYYGLDDSYSGLNRTLGLTSGAVDVNEFKKIAEGILENDPAASKSSYGKPSFITLEAAALGLPCNALAIVMNARNGAQNVPLVYTLLMEPSEPLAPREYNVGNYTVELKAVTGDIYGDDFARAVMNHVKKVTNSDADPIDTGANVVPNGLSLKDDENATHVRSILFFAFGALNTVSDVMFGTQKFLSLKVSGQQQLLANINWSGKQLETAAGNPIRADIVLTTTKRARFDRNQTAAHAAATRPVTALAAYMDLFYAPPRIEENPNQQQYGYSSYGIPADAKVMWYPRMVITRCLPLGKVINVGELLLTLATATVIGTKHTWINGFRPVRGQVGIHDIGGLGWEHEFVKGQLAPIDSQDPKFSLPGLLSQTVVDNLFYSMDIDEVGDLTWLESSLLAIARGGEEAAAANDYIIAAANALTDNKFSECYDVTQPILVNEVVRVHTGYYMEGDQKVDLRNIDHLAVLNMTGKNGFGLAQKWSNALVDYPNNNALSQQERQNILGELAPNAVINGYASRVTFNSAFLFGLASAISKAGTTLVVNDDGRQATQEARVTASYASFGQGNVYTTSLVSQGYGNGQNRSPRAVQTPVSGNIWGNI